MQSAALMTETTGRRRQVPCLPRVRIGTSGWMYDEWRGAFYPTGLRVADRLAYAACCFNSLEINASFYSLQTPATYARWYAAAPRGFRFALKGSGFITHRKRLRDVAGALANFYASGVLRLREKLGPTVWQLPAGAAVDLDRLEAFLAQLPRDSEAAARLAARHDHRVAGRAWTATDRTRPLRHALELRDTRYFTPQVAALLRRQRIALVISDAATWPRSEMLTAGFVYGRLHGSTHTYASRYTDCELADWARRIRRWSRGGARQPRRDVYVYFDNTAHGHAPTDAQRLCALLAARG